MQEKIKLDEFQEYIDKGELDVAFEKIVNKSIDLVKKIAIMKGLFLKDIENIEDRETLFFYFIDLFEENSASFQTITTLMRNFTRWDIAPEDDFDITKEQKIVMYIIGYNSIVYELEEYENIKREIQEKGYENLKNEKIQKLISVFKEMLEYKHKKYNNDWSFEEWIKDIDRYYHFYHEDLENALSQVRSNTLYRSIYMDYQVYIQTNEVENIIALDDLCHDLDPETGEYKNFANFYRDIELKEGQTYEDLYNEEKEKFIELFKKMLNYINVKYEDNSFEGLKSLIRDHFPYYRDNIISLNVMMSNPTETYISLLNSMEDIYNYFSKTYKKHEDNMRKYKEELE